MSSINTTEQLSSLSLNDQVDAREVVYQGTTIVAPPPAPVYHYAIVLKHDRIRLWFEDSDTKNRWCTRSLRLEDYVDSSNSLPSAQPVDYVESFHASMNVANREEATDIPISFYPCDNGAVRLKLAVKVQVAHQERVVLYSFDLAPILVDPIKVLEAQVRDLQGEVKALKQELKARDARMKIFNTKGTGQLGNTLTWATFEGEGCTLSENASVIRIDDPGVYHVVVVVNCASNGSQIKLMKGNECIQSVRCGNSQPCSTTLTWIDRMEQNDQLSVVCAAEIVDTNHLTLVRLGN